MSGSVCTSINIFPTAPAFVPEKLHDCGRRFGLLSSIQLLLEEDCQIAKIGERLVVLPIDLDLSEYLNQRIGMVRIGHKYHIRRLTG
jgi:hypothetical protein